MASADEERGGAGAGAGGEAGAGGDAGAKGAWLADHAHARAMLGAAVAAGGEPSHAYLFHGPAGTGKRATAREFAAALLQAGAREPASVGERVARGTHPDLTWVRPSGASEMLVGDIEEAVVGAAARTPFESARRVFVIESVEAMNDQAANRMLKTLEEPPSFVHLVLLSDRREDVLETIASRCLHVRFDPLPSRRIAEGLTGVEPARALACGRLAHGDPGLAARLAGEEGGRLREAGESFARCALSGSIEGRPWVALLEAARAAGERRGAEAEERLASELELIPAKERRRYEREALESRRRGERRARMGTLDLGLKLGELWLRDVLCVREGVPELVLASDREGALAEDAEGIEAGRLEESIELVGDARLSLRLNVSEELALESLAFRLSSLLAR